MTPLYLTTQSYHLTSDDLNFLIPLVLWPDESNLTEHVDHWYLVNAQFLDSLLKLVVMSFVDLYAFETFIMEIVDAHLINLSTVGGLDTAVTMDTMEIEISHRK